MPRNQNIFHFESVASTNDVCFEKCRLNEETNIIIANQQTQGRGRNSKKWVSPKGNISISIGFISDRPVEALSVKTGLVAARTVKEVFGKNVGIKWPNDLILNKKKIGGILTETENSNDSFINVVGVGLNLQIKAEERHWGSLNEKLQSQAKDNFLQKLPNNLLDSIEKGFGRNWVDEWEKICVHLSEEVKLRNTNETVIFSGINSDGSMIALKDGVSVRVDESSISIEGVY